MANLYGSIRLRPTRIGFLVRPTQESRQVIRQIMRLCCCLWGGRYNPIIPVGKRLPLAWRREPYRELAGRGLADAYLRFFEPDVFVEAEEGLADEAGINRKSHIMGRQRVVKLADFIVQDEVLPADFAYGLNIIDLYRHLYETEFQFVPRHERPYAIFNEVNGRSAFAEAVFGVFPSDSALAYVRDGYLKTFDPKPLRAEPATYLQIIRDRISVPFSVARGQIKLTGGRDDPTIYLFDPSQTVDLIDYWNLRQFRQDVLPFPIQWLPECAEFIRDLIIRNHRPLPRNSHGVMIQTTVELARSITKSTADNLVTTYFAELPPKSWSFKLWYDPIWRTHWRGGGIQPRRLVLDAGSRDVDIQSSESSSIISFQPMSPAFADEFGLAHSEFRWVNIFRMGGYGWEAPFATNYLPNTKDPSFPRLRFGDPAIISREGIALPQQFHRQRESLEMLSQREAIIGWLKERGIEATASSSGRNADQVFRAVGDLRGSWLFADADTLKLLNKMAKTAQQASDGTVTQYPDRTATIPEWKRIIQNRAGQLPALALSRLTDKNVLRLGMAIRCPHCAQENWYSLTALDYSLTCERCLKAFDFPQGELKFSDSDWRYRVVGPFSLPDYALGAYSTILSLRLMREGLDVGRGMFTFSTGLDLEHAGSKFEVDFVAWYRSSPAFWEDPDPVLVFGESKSFGTEVFHQKDVDRLQALAHLFPGAYFVFSALKKELGKVERERIRRFAEWGRVLHEDGQPRASVIVLTGTELFYQWNLSHTWEKLGGTHGKLIQHPSVRVDDLWTLADLTQQLYLGLPTRWEWQRKRRRVKPAAAPTRQN